jgi:heme/copper-type cytochrome/quinol oxidase subunit 2
MAVLMRVLLIAAVIVVSMTGSSATRRSQDKQIVEIAADRFSFTPSEFGVKAGTDVEIRLRSDDTNHGFRILGTDVSTIIPKRGKGQSDWSISGTFRSRRASLV